MNYKKIIPIIFILLCLILSGCLEFFENNDTTGYPEQATKITYQISYGYEINCTGDGAYKIKYDCDKPELINGEVLSLKVLGNNYSNKTGVATFNNMASWNISENKNCSYYKLGISASVTSESLIVNDLNGKNALDLSEIKNNYSELVETYCRPQGNNDTIFIDPNNQIIKAKSLEIYNNSNTDNSFIIAKNLFIWLKENTNYLPHETNTAAQPASITMDKKTGDCDDLTFLYLSMCKSLDIPSRFIRGFLVYENQAVPHAWAEVYVGGNIGKDGWIPVECAGDTSNNKKSDVQVHQHFGLESADHLRLFTDDGTNTSLETSLAGISLMSDQNIEFDSTDFFTDINKYKTLEENKLVIDKSNYRSFE